MAKVLAVALSGGVDSSVALQLLKKDWSQIVGASHYIWKDSRCCTVETLNRARYLCKINDIPYYKLDLSPQFKVKVVDDFSNTYLMGQTPNPCVRCNERIRFSLFYETLKERLREEGRLSEGDDLYFATGHYVKTEKTEDGYFLKRAKDTLKDQTYMLYRIPKKILEKMVFPLGDMTKAEVVSIAREEKMPSASARESQDACFLDGGEYSDFLTEYTGRDDLSVPGIIMDTNGNALGQHKGYIHYTIGQRKGLGLGNGPWYVTEIRAKSNHIIVGRQEELGKREFTINDTNWFFHDEKESFSGSVKIRYQSKDVPCSVEKVGDDTYHVILEKPASVTPGQSAVFYDGEYLLGGGIIVA
ncbi:tRNA 2-thiouridine(34) synthase MnmA [Spirochaeta cellobiosiphila]|uniref:tRNA 2-thiouridine(34) synthase MnmA n=1 Tax=Spirochaeta cellobiosiphila TaxID=504483 RepID=UPI00040ABD5A|nr:tRNA 2-thiouridine(34) synthase MnmA [Spirochaeta cellobiosiphila]